MTIRIEDGPNVWDSPAIVPSSMTPASPSTAPTWVNPQSNPPVGAAPVNVYVRVDNLSAQIEACPTGPWDGPIEFTGFAAENTSRSDSKFGWTISATSGGADGLSRAGFAMSIGHTTTGRKCWGWSPDGHFFAFAYDPDPTANSGRRWHIVIHALDDATRFDGSPIVLGTNVTDYPSGGPTATVGYNEPPPWKFDQTTFGWVGSSGVFTHGISPSNGLDVRRLLAFRGPTPRVAADSADAGGSWLYLASPCGSQIALVASGTIQVGITWMSTVAGDVVLPKQNLVDAPNAILTSGSPTNQPGITTTAHTVLGVSIDRGTAGSAVHVDDPDDTEQVGGLTVHVDRVKVSSLTTYIGLREVGGAIAGEIPALGHRWVEVPNRTDWANGNVTHWCLLAQAYDNTAVPPAPRLWDGLVASPPAFPNSDLRCSQRNIDIV